MLTRLMRALTVCALPMLLLLAVSSPAAALIEGPPEFTWTLDGAGRARFDACGSNGGTTGRLIEYKWVIFQFVPPSDETKIEEQVLHRTGSSPDLCDAFSYTFPATGRYRVVLDIQHDTGERQWIAHTLEVVLAQADLAVSVTDGADPVVEGHGGVTYTIVLTNNGPDAATGVELGAIVSPAGGADWSLSSGGGMVCGVGSGLSCDAPSLAAGASFQVRVHAALGEPGTLSLSAHASSDVADPDASNDSAVERTTVRAREADLAVSVTDGADPVVEGRPVTHTVTLTNNGPDAATGVVLGGTVSPPTDVTWSVSQPGGMACSEGSGWRCEEAAIAPGETREVRITARRTDPGEIRVSAHASSDVADPDASNDSAVERTTVIVDDQVPPDVVGIPGREPDSNGWYARAVMIDWRATDPDPSSGAPDDPPDTRAETEGRDIEYTSERSCDPAGNCARGSLTLSIDATDPRVTCASERPVFRLAEEATTISADVSDDLSGAVEKHLSAPADTSRVGVGTVEFTGSDEAGNRTTVGCEFVVRYVFEGFLPPLHGGRIPNIAKAGQTIPLSWRLTDASGAPVTDLTKATVTAEQVTCPRPDGEDPRTSRKAARSRTQRDRSRTQRERSRPEHERSRLHHIGGGFYLLTWKTDREYARTCQRMRLDLGEGVVHTALIRFIR